VRLGFHGQVRLDSSWPAGIYTNIMLLRRVAFPDFCEPCLPSPAPKPPAGAGWLHEIKHDGFRMLVRRDAPDAQHVARGRRLGRAEQGAREFYGAWL
jgi:ATP-dependent DNA ligase